MAMRTLATVDDLLRLTRAGESYELVDGELVKMAPTGLGHGRLELKIGRSLDDHVQERQLGVVVVGEVLFRLDPAGRLARAADVAFIRAERVPPDGQDEDVFEGAPDLVVEIVSPGDSADDVQRKVDDWLTHGTQIVVLVYPRFRRVILWRHGGAVPLRGNDDIRLDPVLPDFRCKVSDFF